MNVVICYSGNGRKRVLIDDRVVLDSQRTLVMDDATLTAYYQRQGASVTVAHLPKSIRRNWQMMRQLS